MTVVVVAKMKMAECGGDCHVAVAGGAVDGTDGGD